MISGVQFVKDAVGVRLGKVKGSDLLQKRGRLLVCVDTSILLSDVTVHVEGIYGILGQVKKICVNGIFINRYILSVREIIAGNLVFRTDQMKSDPAQSYGNHPIS